LVLRRAGGGVPYTPGGAPSAASGGPPAALSGPLRPRREGVIHGRPRRRGPGGGRPSYSAGNGAGTGSVAGVGAAQSRQTGSASREIDWDLPEASRSGFPLPPALICVGGVDGFVAVGVRFRAAVIRRGRGERDLLW
jgi:hypothetical protein